MTVFFIGTAECYHRYAYDHGFSRDMSSSKRLGRDIVLVQEPKHVLGRRWEPDSEVVTCDHCFVEASRTTLEQYREALDRLEFAAEVGVGSWGQSTHGGKSA